MTIAQKLRDSIIEGWSYDALAADASVANEAADILDDMLAALRAQEDADAANEISGEHHYRKWRLLVNKAKALRLAAISKAEAAS